MEAIIDLYKVSKKYGTQIAVHDYELQLFPGSILALLGPNGSGKSTLIKIMTGLMSPTTGMGWCLGYDLIKANSFIREKVGYMPQKFSLYRKLTVYENLSLFADIYKISNSKQQVERAIIEFGLEKYRNHYAASLSGGWQQRLSLAVSVIHNPRLLILDEPTAGVDPDSRQIIWTEIQRLAKKGMAIIVATHYMDEAQKAHLIQFLFFGRLVAKGSRQDIVAHSKLHTWEISGKQIGEITNELNAKHPHLQVLEFGDHIRVSAEDGINTSFLLCISKNYNCKLEKVVATLEDCFVHYCNTCKDDRL